MTDSLKTSSLRKRMTYAILIVLLAVLALAANQIDDWSRDLTTNVAETSEDAEDPLMRSLVLDTDFDSIESVVEKHVSLHPQWDIVGVNKEMPERRLIILTRTTRWLQFVDDVLVDLTTNNEQTHIQIHSQSRVGKGDLGQNPRNIRELNAALRVALEREPENSMPN